MRNIVKRFKINCLKIYWTMISKEFKNQRWQRIVLPKDKDFLDSFLEIRSIMPISLGANRGNIHRYKHRRTFSKMQLLSKLYNSFFLFHISLDQPISKRNQVSAMFGTDFKMWTTNKRNNKTSIILANPICIDRLCP